MPRSKNGQLTQGDRMAIEQQLKDCTPLPEIARGLGVAPSTVAREIKRDLCQDFGHGSSRNQAAIGMASGLGAVLSKKAAMASAGTL